MSKHIPLQQIKEEYNVAFQIYDYVEDVTISGGEPLTHPNITDIIDYSMNFESQFDHLRIFSNGTIVPSKKLMEQFKHYNKLSLVIDDYGSKISTKVADIRKLFENENLPLRIINYSGNAPYAGGWIDFGSFEEFRNYSDAELEVVYKNCHEAQYKCLGVYNGKMVNCSIALMGSEANVFCKDDPRISNQIKGHDNILNILDTSISLQEKREIVSKWGKVPHWQCQFCNGFNYKSSKRIPGGEQI